MQCGEKVNRKRKKYLRLFYYQILHIFISSVETNVITSESQAMIYLSEYGYIAPILKNTQSGHYMSREALSDAIMDFQAFADINITGYLDEQTLHVMSLPRCGVRDRIGGHLSSKYALQGSRWKVKNLTYKISKYPRRLTKSETDEEVSRAFSVWSEVAPLTFTKKYSGPVHIDIRFEVGEHGDGDPFDGPGGTLAHAFFPIYGGDAHFDDSERWTVRTYKGTNLFQVAAHEFGHSLGLAHSNVKEALMAPFYRGYQPFFQLHDDDIEGIQVLYGSKGGGGFDPKPPGGEDEEEDDDNTGAGSGKPTSTLKPPSTVQPPNSTIEPPAIDGDPELCPNGKIDTIFNSAEGVTYIFKGSKYWKLTDDGIATGYPKLISDSWIGLPNDIDAAFTYKNGETYFFKDSIYWKFNGKKMSSGYPKNISDGFVGIPNNIEAALVWSGNGKIYFFKGDKYWKFDPAEKPSVSSSYPKPISNWLGIPNNIDDAFQYVNGYTYFFKNGKYWRFNDRMFAVDIVDPPFPRNSNYWWFGCRPKN